VAGGLTTVANNQVQVAAVINKSTTNGVVLLVILIVPEPTVVISCVLNNVPEYVLFIYVFDLGPPELNALINLPGVVI
jgi:hypothetical protein